MEAKRKMKLTEAIGKRVDKLLKERNMIPSDLANKGGIPRSTISVIRAAKRDTVKIATIYDICATLEISLKDFFDDEIFNFIDD